MTNNNHESDVIVNVAAIGSTDSVYIFNSIGIKTFQVKSPIEADRIIFNLANSECKIIYISEDIYSQISETIEKYSLTPFPIIIPIPIAEKSLGLGKKKIKDNVEKAIGIDIL